MNPELPSLPIFFGLVLVLCTLLVVAGGLIHTSFKRRKAITAGVRNMSSWILDDLQPVESLLVEFVGHSPEMRDALAVLVAADKPRSFTRIVHEMRLGRATPIETSIAAYLTAVALGILFIAGLVRMKRKGFIATAAGREVQLRLHKAPGALPLAEPAERGRERLTSNVQRLPFNGEGAEFTRSISARFAVRSSSGRR